MTEEIYKDILSEAGVDFFTVSSGISFVKENSRNPKEFRENLLADALFILNKNAPEVEKLHFYYDLDTGKIFVECPETDFSAEYRPRLISNLLWEIEDLEYEEY